MFLKILYRIFDKYLVDLKNKYEKEMEELKHKYDIELANIKAELDNSIFISKMQYEKEYKVYQELWSLQVECIDKYYECANRILGISDVMKQNIQATFLEDVASQLECLANEFEARSLKYKPFIDNGIYTNFRDVSKHAINMMASINDTLALWQNDIGFETKVEKLKARVRTEIGMISDARERTSNSIRKYLNDLKIKRSAN